MELSWLEDFLTLASSGNFSISAAQRNMTQSAFSKRIKALENWLGTELVDRRSFPAVLTPAGQAFREVAQTTLNTMHSERGRLQSSFVKSRAELKILSATTLLLRFAPEWISDLQETCGSFSVSLKTQNFYTMVQSLYDREVDFVLQYSHPALPSLYDKSNIQSLVLTVEKFLPVSAPENGKPKFDLDETHFEDIPRLHYSEDGFLARMEGLIFARNQVCGEQFGGVLESPIAEVLKSFAALGHGVVWLPASCVMNELAQKTMFLAGGEAWQEELEVRLYALKEFDTKLKSRIWEHLSSQIS
ncbi:MAG: LysR family transcriptional regulator [Rhizobiales bacterium]|nr:LysR family transcriptional regulator [Hyphomicrobiales bacterium]